MQGNWKGWIKAAAGVVLASIALSAIAQDWTSYGGDNQRAGRNVSPAAASGPGRSFLRWWRPNAIDNVGVPVEVDNTSVGFVASTGIWSAPASVADEAGNPFLPD